MTTLREAAQMALDALEWSYDVTEWPANGETPQDKAIEALRAALAQPEQEIKCQHKFEVDEDAPLHSCCQICGEVRKQPDQEPPCKTGSQCVGGKCEQCAVQEPVAWMHPTSRDCVSTQSHSYKDAIPLYTAPPKEIK